MAGETSKRKPFRKKREMPGGLWMRCPDCGGSVYRRDVESLLQVCPECNFHFEISIRERIEFMLDEGSFSEVATGLTSSDPLQFQAKKKYADRLVAAQKSTGLEDACVVGTGKLKGHELVFGGSDSRFLRGSMGSVVGEKFARAVELATARKLPFVFVSGSGGGARMDEGVLSLMQMAKTSAALARHDDAGCLFVSILTNPTMGGCMASFAALGDVTIAEPRALLGFAGPTVIRDTIRADLPPGFQTSEFLLEHGFLDGVVNRCDQRDYVASLLEHCLVKG
ncbi:MAG: acetyl-CoA carboxylase carboxyltransferase subunit beta [Planctomycetes bacterium]|nr:acetyl-CoA carboxylase carboxyltransferase subunit beta [Planctomycetota bacterium]